MPKGELERLREPSGRATASAAASVLSTLDQASDAMAC
jgi:hypothetical protein